MKRVYIDMDGVLCNFAKAHAEGLANDPTNPYPQSRFGFWTELEPIFWAVPSFDTLNNDPRFDVWILSKPSFDNLNSFSEKAYWVNKWFGPKILRKLILCGDKSLLKGDYLIDDAINAGQLLFQGELILFGSERFANWRVVLNYLNSKK